MALRGNLRDFTITQLLNLINLASKTGTLVVDGVSDQAHVAFQNGKLAFARIGKEDNRLATVLHRANKLTANQYRAIVERAGDMTDKELGLLLINAGYVTREDILSHLQEYFAGTIRRLYTWVEGSFRFESELLPPEDRINVRLDHATGLIVGLPDEARVKGLRPLRDVLDARPIVTPEMLRLCRWVADYYMAPLGEVLKAAIPHGFAPAVTRVVSLGPSFRAGLTGEVGRRPRGRDAVLSVLRSPGGITTRALQKRTGITSINALLAQLAAEGLVEIEEVLRTPGGGTRVEQVIVLEAVSGEGLRAAFHNTPARKKATRRLLAAALIAVRRTID